MEKSLLQQHYESWYSIVQWLMNIPILKNCFHFIFNIYIFLFIVPFYYLFRNGPWWIFGMEGQPSYEICNKLTNTMVGSNFWNQSDTIDNCENMIFHQFSTYITFIQFLIYCISMYLIFHFILRSINVTSRKIYYRLRRIEESPRMFSPKDIRQLLKHYMIKINSNKKKI